MQAQVEAKGFNGNVLVAKNGTILYQKAFGYANYTTKAPLDLNSVFQLGSVSKQFAAMSILLLKEQGKLSLSDSLRKFFPELPYHGITVQQLLVHTSGLPNHEGAMLTSWDRRKVASNMDMVQFLAREKPPIHFKPGQRWEYSNTGYSVLSAIVEKVSGQSWGEFTAQYIFKPLGMTRSRVYVTRRSKGEVISNYAYGYVYSDSLQRYILPDSLPQFHYVYWLDGIHGDDGINSTVGDLLKWDRALKNHTLLSEMTQREMLSPQALSDTVNKKYSGYGVVIGKRDNRDYIAHSGGWPGYDTYLVRYIADDVTIVVLSNNQSNTTAITNALKDIMFDKPVALPKREISVPILASYVGVYEFSKNDVLAITTAENRLQALATNQSTFFLFPESDAKFYPKSFEAQVEFVKDDSGKVTKMVWSQGGQTLEGKKIK